jgi:hypothetical protein
MKKALLFLVVFFLGTSIAQSQLVDQKIMRDTLNARMARDTVKDIGKIATQFRLSALNTAPANPTDTGVLGEIRIVNGYTYICVATNT